MIEPRNLSRSVAGFTALITGAASGIGRATAQIFAAEGAKLALLDIRGDDVESLAAGLRSAGANAQAFTLDLRDPAAILACVSAVALAFGGLDFVINNAGVGNPAGIDDLDYEEIWESHFGILLKAHQRIIRAALPSLRRSACPRIVNIGSTESLGAMRHGSIYAAAKHGVVGLTRALAVDLGREGITVNCVCPGPIRTGLTEQIPEEQKAIFAKRYTALGRYAEPEEIAHMILNLCLPASSYVTGAVIAVDGGLTARNG